MPSRKERRPYRSPVDGVEKLAKEGDSHYHFRRSCVEKAVPPFKGGEIVIPPEVNVRLKETHKEVLRKEFGQ